MIAGVASETEGLLALITSTKPDIVILDWDLPDRPVADRLVQASQLKSRPRFIVLGSDGPAAREESRQAGMMTFVVKGEPPELLLAAYRQTKMEIRIAAGHSTT